MSGSNLASYEIITNGDMTLPLISKVIPTKFQDNIGIQATWTGVPFGSITVQVSVDYDPEIVDLKSTATWSTLTLSSLIAPVGMPDDAYISIHQIEAPYMRVLYTPISGSGFLSVWAAAKQV